MALPGLGSRSWSAQRGQESVVVITMETALFLTRWQNAPRQRTRVRVSASSDQEKLSCHSPSSSQIKSRGSRLNAFVCLSHRHVPRASVDGFISFGFVHEHGLEFSSSTCFSEFLSGESANEGDEKTGRKFCCPPGPFLDLRNSTETHTLLASALCFSLGCYVCLHHQFLTGR